MTDFAGFIDIGCNIRKRTEQLMFVLFTMLFITTASASDILPQKLDQVTLQMSARDWVTTDKALVQISINRTLDKATMVQAREEVLSNLKKLANGDWHITRFNRSQDSSGLEKLTIQAEARVAQNALTDIYQKVKEVSKPGSSYQVDAIDFTPGLTERQQVKNRLREKLYQQVQQELQILNKAYPEQHYTVNRIVFIEGTQVPMEKSFKSREMNTMVMAAAAPSLSVSNKITLSAYVQLASTRMLSPVNTND